MDLMTIVNIVHMVTSIFWAGGAFTVAWFIGPTVKAIGPEGSKFMQGFAQTRFPQFMDLSAIIALLTGFYMVWVFSGGLDMDWIASGKGLTFTIGGLVAVGAYSIGLMIQKPTSKLIAALGKEIQAGGGPPTPEQGKNMQAYQQKISAGARWIAILLLITIIAMALGRRLY